jgi:hypothetical protein
VAARRKFLLRFSKLTDRSLGPAALAEVKATDQHCISMPGLFLQATVIDRSLKATDQ